MNPSLHALPEDKELVIDDPIINKFTSTDAGDQFRGHEYLKDSLFQKVKKVPDKVSIPAFHAWRPVINTEAQEEAVDGN